MKCSYTRSFFPVSIKSCVTNAFVRPFVFWHRALTLHQWALFVHSFITLKAKHISLKRKSGMQYNFHRIHPPPSTQILGFMSKISINAPLRKTAQDKDYPKLRDPRSNMLHCYIPRLSLNKTSTVTGWILVTCPWSNSNVSRPGYNCAVVARAPNTTCFCYMIV